MEGENLFRLISEEILFVAMDFACKDAQLIWILIYR